MKNVVITGVSTGIGKSLAEQFIAGGYRVFGSVRRQEDAENLKKQLGELYQPLVFDITDSDGLRKAANEVQDMLQNSALDVLINNAGVTINGPLMHLSVDDLKKQFEVNVFAQMAVTQSFLPLLGATRSFSGTPGRIYFMGSISGKLAFPFIGPYCGSKFALEGLVDTLRREVMLYGIQTILIQPGPIATPIWDKAEESDELSKFTDTDFAKAGSRFKKFFIKQGKNGMDPDTFKHRFWKIHSQQNPKPRHVIMHNKLKEYIIPLLLSDRMLDKAVAGQLGLSRSELTD